MTTIAVRGMMQRLRDETSEHHKRAEAKPLERMLTAGQPDAGMYSAMLAQRFLAHRALEAHIAGLAARDARVRDIVPPILFQTENLRRDLAYFDIATDTALSTSPRSDDIHPLQATAKLIAAMDRTAVEQPTALLGFYYVFEGSKNGARFIAARVGPILGLASGHPGLLYLDPHGQDQRELWRGFKQRMDAAHFTAAEVDAMVECAKLTFECVGELDDQIAAGP
jgi:heme oxygenase